MVCVTPESSLIRVLAARDGFGGGGDSLSMPFGYEYDDGYIYIPLITGG